MNTKQPTNITNELESFLGKLETYRYYRLLQAKDEAKKKELTEAYLLRKELLSDVGRFRQLITELTGKEEVRLSRKRESYPIDMWLRGLRMQFDLETSQVLGYCIDVTTEAIGTLKSDIEKGIRDKQGKQIERPPIIDREPPKAFIAHEGMTRSLDKVKSFLDVLRIKYLIAEIEPSDGRAVERQVQWTQGQADFAVILATKGKVINKKTGKPYMGMNVADELGRAREVFKNRIILLLQRGVEPHTNVSGIVYEPFTPQNMEKAFVKIARELSNWGYLKAVRIEE